MMSAGDQGDPISKISQEDESEISSTTPENDNLVTSGGKLKEISTETGLDGQPAPSKSSETTVSAISDLHVSDKTDENLENPSTSGKALESSEIEDKANLSDKNTEISPPGEAIVSGNTQKQDPAEVTKELDSEFSKLKDTAELIQADADKDSSSVGEELELRWEDDSETTVSAISDLHVSNKADENLENLSTSGKALESSEIEDKANLSDKNTETSPPGEAIVSGNTQKQDPAEVTKELDSELFKPKDIAELIQADADKDSSSIGEELELRWEDDDDDNDEGTAFDTTQTEFLAKMLDIELEDAEKLQEADSNTTKEPSNETVNDENINKIDVADDSFEESQKIIAEIDNLTREDEVDNTTEMLSSESVTKMIDQLTEKPSDKDVKMSENVLVSSEKSVEELKLKTVLDKNLLESSPKHDAIMDVDDSENIAKDTSTEVDSSAPQDTKPVKMLMDDVEDSEKIDTNEITTTSIKIENKMDCIDNVTVKSKHDLERLGSEIDKTTVKIEPQLESIDSVDDKIEDGMDIADDINVKIKDKMNIYDDHPIVNISKDKEDLDKMADGQESEAPQKPSNASIVDELKVTETEKIESDIPMPKLETIPIENFIISDNNMQTEETIDATSKVSIIDKPSDVTEIDKSSNDQVVADKSSNNINKTNENVSLLNDSVLDTTITPNVHHRINMPNVMLDIPTQEFSDIEAELSDSELNDELEENNKTSMEKVTTESNNVVTEESPIPTIETEATTSTVEITKATTTKTTNSDVLIETDDKSKTDDHSKAVEKSSTDEDNQSPSKIKDEPSASKIQDDPSTSKIQDVPPTSKIPDEPSTSKIQDELSTAKIQDESLTSSVKQEIKDKPTGNLSPDDTDDVQEITDSLGLLAESSHVPDDNDDDDEDEAEDPDDNDEDEDFDPYDESSSQMLEDSDGSDRPPSEALRKADAADDIDCVENELPGMPSEEKEQKAEAEVIDADVQTDKPTERQPEQIIHTVLEKVLGSLADTSKPKSVSGKVLNYVEVEGSSDSDDVQEVSKSDVKEGVSVGVSGPEVDAMLTSGSGTEKSKGEVVGVPLTSTVAKLNISEITIKAVGKVVDSAHKSENKTATEEKPKEEVFNLDSDEEEEEKNTKEESKIEEKTTSPVRSRSPPKVRKCINPQCTNASGDLSRADRATVAFYSLTRRSGATCAPCRELARERSQNLISGIKDLRPLLQLDIDAPSQQLVEISDSDEDEDAVDDTERVGEDGARYLQEHLADMFNATWLKYDLEARLKQTETELLNELELMEAGAKELDAMLDECQLKTDVMRSDFYKDYEPRRKTLGGIIIHDTPFSSYSHTEKDVEEATVDMSSRYPKRRTPNVTDPPAKKQAVYVDLQDKGSLESKMEEDKDISVVKLSAEAAPASLPPPGELVRPPLRAGMLVYAMRNEYGTWHKGRVLDVMEKAAPQQFTQCRVKFEHKVKNPCKQLAARCLAHYEPSSVRLTIGTRVIALFKDPQNTARRDAFYAGVVAEVPNPVNNYRYLVFFDDGYAQYIQHADTRPVAECSPLVWEEVHPFIRDFIRSYLESYPERPMVRLRQGETLNTEWNGKWWSSRVLKVDASIALVYFDVDARTEWIYRGSTRLEPLYLELQAARAGGRTRLRLPRSRQMRSNMPCVEYTRSDEQANAKAHPETQQNLAEELRRMRSVAKKSTTAAAPAPTAGQPYEGVLSRVVYYTPKNALKPHKITTAGHVCGLACRRQDVLPLRDLRTYNPLAKPLLSGWERQTVRFKGQREVMYRAPCGRRLRNMPELHKYLRTLQSDMSVDLFDFTVGTHCLAEFVLNRVNVGKKDLSHGKENVPVPCVNYYDDSLPEFCSYNTERTPTAGVPLNLDPDFLCGCDCTDDCVDKSKCACWKMTLEGARTIGLEGNNIGYVYRRLPEPLPSGIYECNSRCKCKQTCLNRVAQHPLQMKLQVFKTINRGWGIRALNDVPKGAFLCVYAGNLLTDATANLDGLNEGDEYLAELDYIEVVEGMKEGYEDDVPEEDKALDKRGAVGSSESASELSSESEDEREPSEKDDDFRPGYIAQDGVMFQKSLRKREKAKKKEEAAKEKAEAQKDDCITISDDEEVREPLRLPTADDVTDRNQKKSSRVSVRTLFGKDEACYIMDAKVQGNIGRYLNHSCHPNVFVQNVFVDTHDPRFPWVAFFALSHVRAGSELTWNYNYDVGSVPDKVLYCYCGAPNCRGRLL